MRLRRDGAHRRKDFSLRGTDPLSRIEGGNPAGMVVAGVRSAFVENLGFRANVDGIIVRSDTLFVGSGLRIASNSPRASAAGWRTTADSRPCRRAAAS